MSGFLASIPHVAVCLIVCCAKIIEISIQSLKTVMMVKGQKLVAACLGFTECMIWGLVISTLITTLGDDITLLVCYCLGYAMGLFLGSTIEGKLAIGTSNIELIANDESTEKIVAYLKEKNRGYTVFEGRGSIEKMNMIFIVLPRKEASRTIKEIKAICDNKVFVAVGEVSRYSGGYGTLK